MRIIINVILLVITWICVGIYFSTEDDKLKNKLLCIEMIILILQNWI